MCFVKETSDDDQKNGVLRINSSDPELRKFLANGEAGKDKESTGSDIKLDVMFDYLEKIRSDPEAKK